MSDRRFPRAKWVLPDVIDPPDRVCFKVYVPNNRFHIAAFRGAMLTLSSAIGWQDDVAHTAKKVALVWRDIVDALKPGDCDCPKNPFGGEVVEDEMALHVDCDCNVSVDCCDGTQVKLAKLSDLNQPGQPGAGSPQPFPGGGSASYCIGMNAASKRLIPTPVSTGDVIHLTSASGAGTDDATTLGEWFCPDGSQFFGGQCLASHKTTVSTDPLNTSPHMTVLVNINGTYFDLMAGDITVPGGVSMIQPTIQVNDSDLTNNAGDYSICVQVVNNGIITWRHDFDFTVSDFASDWGIVSGSPWSDATGTYVPGLGYYTTHAHHDSGTHSERMIRLLSQKPANLTSITVTFTYTSGALDCTVESDTYIIFKMPSTFADSVACPTSPVSPRITALDGSSQTVQIVIFAGTSLDGTDPGGVAVIKSVHLEGTGTDPFA